MLSISLTPSFHAILGRISPLRGHFGFRLLLQGSSGQATAVDQ